MASSRSHDRCGLVIRALLSISPSHSGAALKTFWTIQSRTPAQRRKSCRVSFVAGMPASCHARTTAKTAPRKSPWLVATWAIRSPSGYSLKAYPALRFLIRTGEQRLHKSLLSSTPLVVIITQTRRMSICMGWR